MIPLPEPKAYSLGMTVKLVSRHPGSQSVGILVGMTAMNGHAHKDFQHRMPKVKYVNPLNHNTPLLSLYVFYSSSEEKLTTLFYKTLSHKLPLIYLRT